MANRKLEKRRAATTRVRNPCGDDWRPETLRRGGWRPAATAANGEEAAVRGCFVGWGGWMAEIGRRRGWRR
nr:hypothetical protein Itr_chr15CG00470 [Ipomoea trifida]GMD96033.1 hypothetical protein Iba_chr15bCG0860 [Ipomoea batatas]GMD99899.1 hypothetical protein Iba_chr15fCG0220 [Ipomoea batatas]